MKFKNHPIILLKPLLAIMGFLAWLTFSIAKINKLFLPLLNPENLYNYLIY